MPAPAMIPGPALDVRPLNQTGATNPPPGPRPDARPECRTWLVR